MSDTNAIAAVFDKAEERFSEIAPPAIQYAAERGFAMQLLTNNGYLMKVAQENKASLAQAITNVAAIGLSLNPAEKQAYLIPRSVKEGNRWVSKVFLEPGYMGLCKLATDSGAIEWVQAYVVHGNDTFIDHGAGMRPTHEYNAFAKAEQRGDIVGCYCVAKTSGGDYLTTIMTIDKINEIMERSESVKAYRQGKVKTGGPWMTDWEEQAKKTVVRRAFKMWPRSKGDNRLAQAVHLSNENEGFEPIVNNPEIREFTAEQKEYFDQLISKADSLGMFVFVEGIEPDVYASLYNSFERPNIQKYKTLTINMIAKGKSQFFEYRDTIAASTDIEEVRELAAELDDETINLLMDRLNHDGRMMLTEVIEG